MPQPQFNWPLGFVVCQPTAYPVHYNLTFNNVPLVGWWQFPTPTAAYIFDCFLGSDSFPTAPPEKDNTLLWDWSELATAAGSRDRSVQIQWNLCHVCQQSHRLNKLAEPLPAKCPAGFKRVLDRQPVCMFTVLWLSPLRVSNQIVASNKNQSKNK